MAKSSRSEKNKNVSYLSCKKFVVNQMLAITEKRSEMGNHDENRASVCVCNCWITSWTYLYMDGTAVIFLAYLPTWGLSLGPKLHPGGGFFGTWPFLILKSSHHDLSYESTRSWSLSCSNTAIFDKLHEFTDFGFLQQSQNRVRFWIC